jgi:DNA-binding CsgD family transcriptional regulator
MLATAEVIAADLDDFPATIACLQARALIGLQDSDLDSARPASVEGVRRSRQAGDLYALEMMLLNLGAVALIGQDLDEAKPLLTEALRIARRIDDRVAQYALLDVLACHAAGSGQPRLAAQLIGAAETVQRGLGATIIPYLAPLIAQARQSTRAALGGPTFQAQYDAGCGMRRDAAIGLALGESAEPPAASTGASTAPLSKREAEVARLVAEGLSNKQIGARLLISEHTVDSHVRSILTKLGFGSRAQVAAWLASAGR